METSRLTLPKLIRQLSPDGAHLPIFNPAEAGSHLGMEDGILHAVPRIRSCAFLL